MSDTLPTPRVDAAINKAGEAVAAECRQIERELAQMTQERDKAMAMVSVARGAIAHWRGTLNDWQRYNDVLARIDEMEKEGAK